MVKVQRDAPSARFTDPADDLLDRKGDPTTGEGYLDIRESVVTLEPDGRYRLVLTLGAPIPDELSDPSQFIEWDLLLQTDACGNNDSRWAQVWNDLRPDYMVRFHLGDAGPIAEVVDLRDKHLTTIEYEKHGERLELHFAADLIGAPKHFDYTVATRAYGDKGARTAFQRSDKAPNTRHYQFPEGKEVVIAPGPPSATLQTPHATLRYNPGDEARAKWLGDDWEIGYAALGQQLGIYPKQKVTLYIYATQPDLQRGMAAFGFSPQAVAFFKSGGAPRPKNDVMHVSPEFDGHDLFHEFTHTQLEEIGGRTYASIKWLDEGLAEHIAQTAKLQCNDERHKSQLALVKQAQRENKLYPISEITTELQWSQLVEQGHRALVYGESQVLVSYLVATHGMDACISVLKKMSEGSDQEAAVQAAFGESLAQMESEFQTWLAQAN